MYRTTAAIAAAMLLLAPAAQAGPGDFNVDSFFDITVDLTAGPPYPTSSSPVEVVTGVQPQGGTDIVPVEIVQLSLKSVQPIEVNTGDGPEPWEVEVRAGDLGGDFGVDSFFDVFYTLPSDSWPVDSFFDITYQIGPPPGGTGGSVDPLNNPELFHTDSFFDVFFDVEIPDEQIIISHHLHGQLAPGMEFTSVTLPPGDFSVDSFFDIAYQIHQTDPPASGSESSPILSMTMNATVTPEPGTVALLIFGGAGAVGALRRRRR
jgi:hypothetical protein